MTTNPMRSKNSRGGEVSSSTVSSFTLKSMTGFGHARVARSGVAIEVEIKTVNHRFLDVSTKLPRVFSSFEGEVRGLIQTYLQRGRVEVYCSRSFETGTSDGVSEPQESAQTGGGGAPRATCNTELLGSLYRLQIQAFQSLGLLQNLSEGQQAELKARLVTDLFRRQDILDVPEELTSIEGERELLLETLRAALSQVASMQEKEGANLRSDLEMRLSTLERLRSEIESRAGEIHTVLRAKMIERVKKLSPEVQLDEARLATEVAVAADRSDITEEVVRLASHLGQFKQALQAEPSGKRFDFLLQEIHREFNTIGSKAQDNGLQRSMLEAKMEIEKIREQVQNIA
jgi:uncharacterized protein (TIGR00255 family)